MKIKDLMRKPVVIEKDVNLSDAAKIMTKYSINSILVVKNGNLVGIATHHDMIRHFGESKKISEIMTKKVLTLKEDDKLERAIEMIREKEIGIFPVLNSSKKIVGILDSKDILKVWDNEDYLIE